MMAQERIQFTPEDIRYLKVSISLALTGPDIQEMPKTQVALNELYDKIERMQGNKRQQPLPWLFYAILYYIISTHIQSMAI
jgi:hypothetical protein